MLRTSFDQWRSATRNSRDGYNLFFLNLEMLCKQYDFPTSPAAYPEWNASEEERNKFGQAFHMLVEKYGVSLSLGNGGTLRLNRPSGSVLPGAVRL